MLLSLLHVAFALNLCQTALAVPAVTTSTRLTTKTSCSCTSKSTSNGHTSTVTISGSSSCTAKKITPTCKTTTSTIKTTFTLPSTSTKHSSTTSSTHTSSHSTSTVPSTSTKTTTTTSSSTPTPSPNSGHRGLAYNDPTLTLPFSLSSPPSKVSWSYNWYSYPYTLGQAQNGYNPALNFVPMLWSTASDLTSVWHTNVANAIASYKTTAVLAFNEPDSCGGGSSCMNVSSAVTGYKQWLDPLAGTVKLGAPAVTNGEGSSTIGLAYLQTFLADCTGCTVDFVPIHWYGDGGDVAGFESYVGQAYAAAGGRPLWVTEVGVTSGDAEGFLKGVKGFLDGDARVERWAWFMDAAGNEINANGTGLSPLGVVYNSG